MTWSCVQGYVEKGLRRAKEFTWEKSARETLQLFEEVVQGDVCGLAGLICIAPCRCRAGPLSTAREHVAGLGFTD